MCMTFFSARGGCLGGNSSTTWEMYATVQCWPTSSWRCSAHTASSSEQVQDVRFQMFCFRNRHVWSPQNIHSGQRWLRWYVHDQDWPRSRLLWPYRFKVLSWPPVEGAELRPIWKSIANQEPVLNNVQQKGENFFVMNQTIVLDIKLTDESPQS